MENDLRVVIVKRGLNTLCEMLIFMISQFRSVSLNSVSDRLDGFMSTLIYLVYVKCGIECYV